MEEIQIDPHMLVPIFKIEDGKLSPVEEYQPIRPQFIQRRDYFTGDWCIINATRAGRPKAFETRSKITGIDSIHPDMYRYTPKDFSKYNGMSPEDVAREIMTNQELNMQGDICRLTKDGRVLMREFLALYPYLLYHSIKTDFITKDGLWDLEAFYRSFEQTAKRTKELSKFGYYPINIRNYGPDSGASQSLDHDQTGGLKIMPNSIRREIEYATQFSNKWNNHLHDVIIQAEKNMDKRIVAETEYTLTFCPFAPMVATRETRILLKEDYKTLDQLYENERYFEDLAESIVKLANAYIRSGVKSFNYAVLQNTQPCYRLNVLFAASQTYGSMERILKTPVIEELPEISAQILRQYYF